MKKLTFLLAGVILGSGLTVAATYYLDAVNGLDSNTGTSSSPWKTLNKAKAMAQAGDTVLLRTGSYGSFIDGTTRADWLTYKADVGATPRLNNILIGGGSPHLRFDGFHIEPAGALNDHLVNIKGNYIEVLNSRIKHIGYWAAGSHSGVYVSANHIKISRCEISHARRGINLRQDGYPNVDHREELSHNYIHDCAATGISIFEAAKVRIEYNHIYRQHPFQNTSGAAIHGSGIGIECEDAIVRYNIIHSYGNSAGIFFYTSEGTSFGHNNIVENNLLYDSGGVNIGIITSGCKFNNNTIIGHAKSNEQSLTDPGPRRYSFGGVGPKAFAANYAGDFECYNNVMLGLFGNITNAPIKQGGNIVWIYEYPSAFTYSTNLPGSRVVYPDYNVFEKGFFVQDPIDFSWPNDQSTRSYCNQKLQDFRLAEGSPAINFGDPAHQTPKGLGTIGPDGFIQDNGATRDANHHSAGAYEYGGVISASAPVISPAGGSHTGAVQVTLTTNTSGGEIRYTTDGSDPTTSSTLYSAPFTLTQSATIKAKTFKTGIEPSTVASAVFTVTADTDAPQITSAAAAGPRRVLVVFNEMVDKTTAENSANYTISGISITSASLGMGNTVVTLTTALMTGGQTYTVAISNVKDVVGNTIIAGSQKSFTYQEYAGYWNLDDGTGTTAQDLSGNNNNGTVTGALWTTGKFSNALSFNGTSNFMEVPNSSALEFGTGDFTFSGWFSSGAGIVDLWDSGAGSAGWPYFWVRLVSSGVKPTVFRIDDGDMKAEINLNVSSYFDGQWHHVVFKRKAGTIYLYIDGALKGSADATGVGPISNSKPNYIGKSTYNGLDDSFTTGSIDDIRLYNRALSAGEILYISQGNIGVTEYMQNRIVFGSLEISPNPVKDVTRLNFNLTAPGYVQLKIYTLSGDLTSTIADGALIAGNHGLTWNAEKVHPGMYVYELAVNGEAVRGRLMVLEK